MDSPVTDSSMEGLSFPSPPPSLCFPLPSFLPPFNPNSFPFSFFLPPLPFLFIPPSFLSFFAFLMGTTDTPLHISFPLSKLKKALELSCPTFIPASTGLGSWRAPHWSKQKAGAAALVSTIPDCQPTLPRTRGRTHTPVFLSVWAADMFSTLCARRVHQVTLDPKCPFVLSDGAGKAFFLQG